jgi:hypothetical protein
MIIDNLTITELQVTLDEVASSQRSDKHQLIRGLQNIIAKKYLEGYSIEEEISESQILIDQLMRKNVKELDSMLDSFLELNLHVPRELYMVREYKMECESKNLLLALLKGSK